MAALDVLSSIFTATWGLFTGVEVPGLGISFAEWFLAIILVGIAVKVAGAGTSVFPMKGRTMKNETFSIFIPVSGSAVVRPSSCS